MTHHPARGTDGSSVSSHGSGGSGSSAAIDGRSVTSDGSHPGYRSGEDEAGHDRSVVAAGPTRGWASEAVGAQAAPAAEAPVPPERHYTDGAGGHGDVGRSDDAGGYAGDDGSGAVVDEGYEGAGVYDGGIYDGGGYDDGGYDDGAGDTQEAVADVVPVGPTRSAWVSRRDPAPRLTTVEQEAEAGFTDEVSARTAHEGGGGVNALLLVALWCALTERLFTGAGPVCVRGTSRAGPRRGWGPAVDCRGSHRCATAAYVDACATPPSWCSTCLVGTVADKGCCHLPMLASPHRALACGMTAGWHCDATGDDHEYPNTTYYWHDDTPGAVWSHPLEKFYQSMVQQMKVRPHAPPS